MADQLLQPARFFDRYPAFLDTSETGAVLDRLNARYAGLVEANRDLLDGATVLDLASHDGRFSFAALQNGARHVAGIEAEPHLVAASRAHMTRYGVPPDAYEFVVGDVFEDTERVERPDVVFCFGILYHVNHHLLLLSKIAETDPRVVIVDTNVSTRTDAVIELRNPMKGYPPTLGGQLEGYPSRAALEAMLASFGWSYTYFDWAGSGLVDSPQMRDYREGRRVTVVVDCHRPALDAAQREAAVATVFERQTDRRSQWPAIVRVATEYGITPQALCVWVRRAERDRNRAR